MRKIISVFCAVILTLVSVCTAVSADDTLVTLKMVPHKVTENDNQIVVDLVAEIADGWDLTACNISITYDNERLSLAEAVSAAPGISTGGMTTEVFPYPWVWIGATVYIEGTVVMATFTFDIKGDAVINDEYKFAVVKNSDDMPISFDGHRYTESEVAYPEGIAVVEEGYKPGDFNGDDVISGDDVIDLLRYLADWGSDPVNLEGADVDGSGKVDSNDAIYYLRHLAGWEGYPIGK